MLKALLFSIFLLTVPILDVKNNENSPNFIFILADDQGWNGTSVKMIEDNELSKSDYYETPNIERIASKGIIFSNAYASAPVCAPSRYSIQFGQTPARLKMIRVGMNTEHIDHEAKLSIPKELKKINPSYNTAHFGKWGMDSTPESIGYDLSDGATKNKDGVFNYNSNKLQWSNNEAVDPKKIFSITERAIDFIEENQDRDTKMPKPDSAASSSSPVAPLATATPSAPSSPAAPKWKAEKTPSAGIIGPEWFDQKEYSNLSVLGMVYELLDNSIYHRVKTKNDYPLKIEISIIEDKNNPKRIHELRIEDNASGMEVNIIPLAFSPYGMSRHYSKDPEALSEHGLGMKAALRGLAETHVIHTSHISDSKTFEITTDDIRYFPTPSPPTLRSTTANVFSHGYNHGTIIRMWNLTEKAQELGWFSDNKKKNNFSKMLSWNLGQRYRNFLMQPYFRQPDTGIFLCRYDHTGKNLLDRVKVEREEPRYWGHQISKKKGTPWFKLHTVQSPDGGKTWKARFTLGQSPKDKEEWTSLGEKPPIQTHPYYVSKANRGFDVLRKGIVLEPKFFVDKNHRNIGSFAKSESAVFNFVRGEIWLDYGFK